MDNFEEIKPELDETEEVDALWISEDVRSFIYETAKWTKFLSIVGFVFSALIALSALSVGAIISTLSAVSPGNPLLKIGAPALTVFYLLISLLQFYPSLLLFKFSNAANQAVLFAEQNSLSVALGNLKSFFKFWGIITIIIIGFYAMIFISAIAIGLSTQS